MPEFALRVAYLLDFSQEEPPPQTRYLRRTGRLEWVQLRIPASRIGSTLCPSHSELRALDPLRKSCLSLDPCGCLERRPSALLSLNRLFSKHYMGAPGVSFSSQSRCEVSW